ncbi:MAG: WecB/TagA/CpsF family glycosyltransferase [Oligoflexia bacterium]|nr:WecB/TagA/CpsF family glycosyltransferase [Oligoflexia bacterium]
MNGIFELFQIPFSTLSQKQTLGFLIKESRKPKASSVILCNAHVVVESEWDQTLKELLQKATLVMSDGTPIAWLLQAKGQKNAQRYSGVDLMEDIFNEDPQGKHFFLGSTPEVIEKIKIKFKGQLAGTYSPPFAKEFSEEEKQKQLRLVQESGAHYVWVGLGAPKQERYVVQMAQHASQGVWFAVGAAFDFYAGVKPRAPRIVQKIGMEWAFRMMSEPRRLTKRYFSTNPVFIKLALQELLFSKN